MAQSMYSVSGLITRTRALLDEPSTTDTYHSDDEIIYWYNLAQIDMASRYALVPYTVTVSGASFDSNKEYTIPVDVVSVERVQSNLSDIPPIAFEPYNSGRWTGRGYYIRGGKIGIPQVVSSDSIVIWGRGQLNELTSASTASLPAYFTACFVDYALARCYEKDQNGELAGYWTGKYEQDLTKAARIYGSMNVQLDRVQDWA